MNGADRVLPVRMCIGCRGRSDKPELVRLVWTGERLVVDGPHTHPGRGAYLHRRSECVAQAVRRRAVSRALRVEGIDSRQLEQVTAGQLVPAGAPVGDSAP